MKNTSLAKAKSFMVVEIIEYVPNAVVIKPVIRRITGNVNVISIDIGEGITDKISPFDTFIHVIEGTAEVIIDDVRSMVVVGQAIIIPAHARSVIKANVRVKMISTVIKSGYEEFGVSL